MEGKPIDTTGSDELIGSIEAKLKEIFKQRIVSDAVLALLLKFPFFAPFKLIIMYLSGRLIEWLIEKTIIGFMILHMRYEVNRQVSDLQRHLQRWRDLPDDIHPIHRKEARTQLAQAYRRLIKLDMAK